MKPKALFGPKLDFFMLNPVAFPKFRARHFADMKFGGELGDPLFQLEAALEHARLFRRPSTNLAAPRTAIEISIGFLDRYFFHRPVDPHFPTH